MHARILGKEVAITKKILPPVFAVWKKRTTALIMKTLQQVQVQVCCFSSLEYYFIDTLISTQIIGVKA